MDFLIRRDKFTVKSTLGRLWIAERDFCNTLEDCDRQLELVHNVKIPGRSAIPRGRYPLAIDESGRFKRLMPHILSVPSFEGVRIHKGNTAEDTEGCPLLGAQRGEDRIFECGDVFDEFFGILTETLTLESCWITIL